MSRAAVTSDAATHFVPESTPTISASDASSRVRCPASGSSAIGQSAGHTERYSPPGPNLHTGSIRPILCLSIPDTFSYDDFRFPPLAGLCSIDHAPRKTQTKTEQIRPRRRPFSPGLSPTQPPPIIWDRCRKKCPATRRSAAAAPISYGSRAETLRRRESLFKAIYEACDTVLHQGLPEIE